MAELSSILKQATGVVAARGEGVHLYDEDDRRYLDFTAGIGVTSTGHCHPKVVEAAQRQVATLIHGQYTTVLHRPLLTLVDRMSEVLPAGLDRMFFANSGSEAVEAALRLARMSTGRPNVIVFHGGFHGRTVAAASMTTSGTKFRSGFSPMMGGVVVSPFPNPTHYGWTQDEATDFALQRARPHPADDHAAERHRGVLRRAGAGRGRLRPGQHPLPGRPARARRPARHPPRDRRGADRLRPHREFWGADHFDVTGDILVTAKGLASGFPLSAIAAPEEIMNQAWPGSQGGTYGANAVACAAALATLDVIQEEKLVDNAAQRGAELRTALQGVADQHPAITDVRGLGLLLGNEFRDADGKPDGVTAAAAQQEAARRGLLLLTCGAWGQVVRFVPALVISSDQITEGAAIWADSVAAVTD